MSDIAIFIPIAGIAASAWVAVTALRYRFGAKAGGKVSAAEVQENVRLEHENEALKHNVAQLEDRLAVLERIVTDPAERTSREIESLR